MNCDALLGSPYHRTASLCTLSLTLIFSWFLPCTSVIPAGNLIEYPYSLLHALGFFTRTSSFQSFMGLKKLYPNVIVRVVGDVPFGVGGLPVH